MNARETILSAVRRNQPTAVGLPEVPQFDAAQPLLWDWFQASLQRMGGAVVEPAEGETPTAVIERLFPDVRVVCSATAEVPGNRDLAQVRDPRELEDVDVGVVRAAFGVAETGSVFLSEKELGVNVLGFLAQHLVVLLDPAELVGNLHQAYRRAEFAAVRYAVLMTGPSATADIEGVLIHGAQGVRTLKLIPWPRPR